ncbi:MAG TPA: SIMPL domain-containing protein [Gaiellaceae bacterium]|nr:SIMPL domain-containing protein [Gaiellaceae bacterium]
MRERVPLFAGLTLLAIAVLLGSVAVGNGIRDRGRSDVVTVTGSAKQRIVSDYAIWDASITAQSDSAAAAAAELADWTAKVRAFLLAQGIRADELSVQPVSTQTVTPPSGGYTNKVTGYQLTRTFEVRSGRVPAVADAAEASSKLLAQGIPLSAQPLQYVFTKLAKLRPALLAAATRDAQERARVLVGATGGALGGIRGVNVGVFQVTSPNSTEVSDYGVYDTSTLRKDVTAVVNVTFALG